MRFKLAGIFSIDFPLVTGLPLFPPHAGFREYIIPNVQYLRGNNLSPETRADQDKDYLHNTFK